MLRSIAAQGEDIGSASSGALRCVSKHEAAARLPRAALSFETRAHDCGLRGTTCDARPQDEGGWDDESGTCTNHRAVNPPSMMNSAPVTKPDSSDSR
jgi:hypothetical protein